MSKATATVGACKDTTWIQVACTIAFSNTAIIGSYETTKKHLIDQVPDNTIAGRSGAFIGQVETNPSEMFKSNWDTHVSDMSNNNLIGYMPCWSTIISNKKSQSGMIAIAAASNNLFQAVAMDQAVDSEAVVAA